MAKSALNGTGPHTLNGTDEDDVLIGHRHKDTINGGKGNDFLDGGLDNDTLNGGEGADTLVGHNGSDLLYGGDGPDVFKFDDWGQSYGGTNPDQPVTIDTIGDFASEDDIEFTQYVDDLSQVEIIDNGDGTYLVWVHTESGLWDQKINVIGTAPTLSDIILG